MSLMFYIRNKEYKAKKLENEVIIFDAPGNKIITLNESGKLIWEYMWKKRKIDEIYAHVANHYEIAESKVRKDIESFLKRASKIRIITQIQD